MHKKLLNGLIALTSFGFCMTAYFSQTGVTRVLLCSVSSLLFLFYFMGLFPGNKYLRQGVEQLQPSKDMTLIGQITELALLNDENQSVAFWGMYGKSSLVLGVDVGENKVDVNLLNSTYGSTIDVEHAVLNYSGDRWYIEDNGSKNGTAIQKQDGKKYMLTAGKPCRVEKGDILYIGMTRLQVC